MAREVLLGSSITDHPQAAVLFCLRAKDNDMIERLQRIEIARASTSTTSILAEHSKELL